MGCFWLGSRGSELVHQRSHGDSENGRQRCARLPDQAIDHHCRGSYDVCCGNRGPCEVEGGQLLPVRPAPESEQRRGGERGEDGETESDIEDQVREGRERHQYRACTLRNNRDDRRAVSRVHAGGRREEGAVLCHGVIDARADGDHGVHGGGDGDGHQYREGIRDSGTEEINRGLRTDGDLAFHLFNGRRVDEDQVQTKIESGNDGGAGGDGEWQRAARVFDFFGDVGGGIPSAITHHHPQKADDELNGKAVC